MALAPPRGLRLVGREEVRATLRKGNCVSNTMLELYPLSELAKAGKTGPVLMWSLPLWPNSRPFVANPLDTGFDEDSVLRGWTHWSLLPDTALLRATDGARVTSVRRTVTG